MRSNKLFFVLVVLSLLIGTVATGGAQAPEKEITRDTLFVPGEVVIGFSADLKQSEITDQANALAGSIGATVADVQLGAALLSFAEDADVLALSDQLAAMEGVTYAEPNYIAWIPELVEGGRPEVDSVAFQVNDEISLELTLDELRALRTVRGGKVRNTFPNDPNLWTNWGWSYVGADLIWPNTPAGKNVCVLDTGVDWNHPDLVGMIIKGKDFVNDDTNPDDDNGHGTHVAGIVAAKVNNKKGMAGVSNGKVVAVKVLGAQGFGTYWDIADGMRYCAGRNDVKVLSMSLGGGMGSTILESAVAFTVNTKKKLLVAAAGNDGADSPLYPAYYVTDPAYSDGILAVGAQDFLSSCRASFSNHGSWVEIVAPGTDIYSTLPNDQPFWLNQWMGYYPDYDWMNGTSMSTPFVSGGAARAWSVFPGYSNTQIKTQLLDTGWSVNADGSCWPTTMSGSVGLDVTAAMDRTAIGGTLWDANNGMPLKGATVNAYLGNKKKGTAKLTSNVSEFWMIINLPCNTDPGTGWCTTTYNVKVSKSGYTAGYVQIGEVPTGFASSGILWTSFFDVFDTGIPTKSNLSIVANWDYGVDQGLYMWLPIGNPVGPYIVGEMFDWGNLRDFPYAKFYRDGGWGDPAPVEIIKIKPRPGKPKWPKYAGDYDILIYDWEGYMPNPILVRFWQGGNILKSIWYGCTGPYGPWWHVATWNNGSITAVNVCGDSSIQPYAEPVSGTMGIPEAKPLK